MNTTSLQTEEELEMVEVEYWVEQAKALDRLENGIPEAGDFKLVITDGYFKDRAVEAVSLLSTDYIRQSGKRPELMESLVAISGLQDHFNTIRNLGAIAEADDLDLNGPGVE